MKKSKVYTKTGDKGETSLVSGNRIPKSDNRIDLYGDLDELNSRVGIAAAHMSQVSSLSMEALFLQDIQSMLFNLGSNMACEVENRAKYKLPQVSSDFVTRIENEIDKMDQELEPLKNFILPGGTILASELHLCRTGARSVERKAIAYYNSTKEELPDNCVMFLNRLSDYFFILARFANKEQGGVEILWKPEN